MFAEVVVFICLATLSTSVPIDPHYGLSYAPAASYAYHAAPAVAYHSAPAIAVAHHAPVYHAPAVAVAAPVIKKVVAEPYDPNPQYSFSYGVTDHHTGDSKHAEESLVNGVVHGSYSLTEPDGTIRKVSYTADDHNGFNAVVEKKGVAKVVAAPVIAHAAPVIAHAAPIYADYHGYH